VNRRGFISLLAGAAGAPLVPWRGLIEPLIVLPGRPHVCDISQWCNHPSHFVPLTAEEIYADVERTLQRLLRNTYAPFPGTAAGYEIDPTDAVRKIIYFDVDLSP
jgi:hypothetical protein